MGDPAETYRQWLHLRLAHALCDDLFSPDQAVAWHELCRELRVGEVDLPDDADEPALAGGAPALARIGVGRPPLWLVGSTRAGGCTLVQDLVLALCDGQAPAAAAPLLPVPLVLCGRSVRGPIGMLGMDVRWDSLISAAAALDRWWRLAERDIRRSVERDFSAAALREGGRPLVVISGMDDLPAASRAAVARWIGELCAAGRELLVTTGAGEVPELAALAAAGRLARAHVQPLARAAVDRFLVRWSRLSGDLAEPHGPAVAGGAALAGPGRQALARRPATLVMQAVLLARTGEAADSRSELQRRLLAGLDLQLPAHRLLLARLVGDRDSPLALDERARWLAVLVAAAGLHGEPELGDALGRDPALAEAGGELLRRAAAAWAEGVCPIAQVDQDMARGRDEHDPHHDLAMARLVDLGRRAGWWRQEHAFVLRRGLPPRERLFEIGPAEIRPRPIFTALADLQELRGACAQPLVRIAPLGYLLAEGGAACPIAAAALSAADPAELRPARDLFHRGVLLELALVSLAADREDLQAFALGSVLRRRLDLRGAVERAAFDGEPGVRAPYGSGDHLSYFDAALGLADRLSAECAPGFAADLAVACERAVTQGKQGARLRRLAAFVVVILLYAVGRRVAAGRRELRRGEILALREGLGHAGHVAATFPEERRTSVHADWSWVLEQPWAPHRVADLVLLHMQESVSLAAADVLPRCHRWLRAFLAS